MLFRSGGILSSITRKSGLTAIHIHRETQHARQNVCITFVYRSFMYCKFSSTAFPGGISLMSKMRRPHLGFGHFTFSTDNRLPALIWNKGTSLSLPVPFYRLLCFDSLRLDVNRLMVRIRYDGHRLRRNLFIDIHCSAPFQFPD